MIDSLLIAVHAFINLVSMSFSVDGRHNDEKLLAIIFSRSPIFFFLYILI